MRSNKSTDRPQSHLFGKVDLALI